jgi:nucleotide-binding universal stress UspA family protein
VTIVVGYTPDESGASALQLASMLARSAGESLVVCAVVTVPWPPSPERIDAEYRELLLRAARHSLVEAEGRMPADIDAEFLVSPSRSVPTGLLDVAAERDAVMIVLGSSSGGMFGHVSLGSVTDRILHSSHVPVALAPRGFRCRSDARVARITTAIGGGGRIDEVVTATAALAARIGSDLRVASFAVSPRTSAGGTIESRAEELVVTEWMKRTAESLHLELAELQSRSGAPLPLDTVIGHGFSWREALEDVPWATGDVLAVGSSATGPAARVFLGSRASKILRHAPVPVVLVPREALAGIEERATLPDDASRQDGRAHTARPHGAPAAAG